MKCCELGKLTNRVKKINLRSVSELKKHRGPALRAIFKILVERREGVLWFPVAPLHFWLPLAQPRTGPLFSVFVRFRFLVLSFVGNPEQDNDFGKFMSWFRWCNCFFFDAPCRRHLTIPHPNIHVDIFNGTPLVLIF